MTAAAKAKSPRLVGVVHLPPLPGSPRAEGRPTAILAEAAASAVREAKALEAAGFDAVILENFADTPFFKDRVPPVTVASMSAVAVRVRAATRLALGINVLRNDARAALAVAAAAGAQFIRVNVLTGAAVTDQGIIEGRGAELARERRALEASYIHIWADVLVKHARPLGSDDPELAAEEAAGRALADALIVTGATTGRAVELARLRTVARASAAYGAPVFVGSGATAENVAGLFAAGARGVIVGSALRRGGRAGAPLEAARVNRFVRAFRAASRGA